MAIPVSANSSWHWISKTRPWDVLPFVIIFTLVIEILAIIRFAKIKKLLAVIFTAVLGN